MLMYPEGVLTTCALATRHILVYAVAFNSSNPLNVYLLILLPSLPLRKVQLGENQLAKDQTVSNTKPTFQPFSFHS